MDVVLDCSVALAWAFPDEASDDAERLLTRRHPHDSFWVPALWWYELTNALTVAYRHKRISESDCLRLIDIYGSLPLQTDAMIGEAAARRWHRLAKDYSLSGYDATYLELAERKDLPLATLDQRLKAAASSAGIRQAL